MRHRLIHLPRLFKRIILVCNDLFLVEACLLSAFYFRLGYTPLEIFSSYAPVFLVTPLCVLFFFYKLELYSSITRHVGVEVMSVLARGVSFGVLLVLLIFFLAPIHPRLPRSVLILFWVFSIFALLSSRLIASRWLHGTSLSSLAMEFAGLRHQRKARGRPVAVYGAGEAGRQLVEALGRGSRFVPAVFIDDDPSLQGQLVAGLKVYDPGELPGLVRSEQVAEVLLALPSIGRHRRQEIIRFLEPLDVHVRSVPALDELAQGLVTVQDIREVDVADILGRETVPADSQLLEASIKGKNIAITGAGGSIGSELCRQIFKHQPRKMVLIDHSEYSLYTLCAELEEAILRVGAEVEVAPILGSVTDGDLLAKVFTHHGVHTIYHAAAYKHVPLVEENGYQGFHNNVCGTIEASIAAMKAGAKQFVLVSTDKAVRPSNLMGASKRLAELVLQGISGQQEIDCSGFGCRSKRENDSRIANGTRFTMVRFGNVLDSSGSVIPKFRKQIREGGPVTVTHPQVTRYFMTIPEAAELVLQANGLSQGGDVFILDMGEPIKIDDLAHKLIHLSGLCLRDEAHPDGDIEIQYTGIRPGEKLYEELLIDDQAIPTAHPKIWRATERAIPWEELKALLSQLDSAFLNEDLSTVCNLLDRPEIGYAPGR